MDDVLKRAIGVVAAVAGTAGAFTLGARSRSAPVSKPRGLVFWVGAFTGEETIVVDQAALATLRRVIGPATNRPEGGVGNMIGGVMVRIMQRGNEERDAFGTITFVVEPRFPYHQKSTTHSPEKEKRDQIRLTAYFRDLVLLGVLEEGGWFARWPSNTVSDRRSGEAVPSKLFTKALES